MGWCRMMKPRSYIASASTFTHPPFRRARGSPIGLKGKQIFCRNSERSLDFTSLEWEHSAPGRRRTVRHDWGLRLQSLRLSHPLAQVPCCFLRKPWPRRNRKMFTERYFLTPNGAASQKPWGMWFFPVNSDWSGCFPSLPDPITSWQLDNKGISSKQLLDKTVLWEYHTWPTWNGLPRLEQVSCCQPCCNWRFIG